MATQWVASLQSRLDEVQSKIDSRIDSSVLNLKSEKEEEVAFSPVETPTVVGSVVPSAEIVTRARKESKSSRKEEDDAKSNIRGALLKLRLETLESQRSVLASARAAVTATQHLCDRADASIRTAKNGRQNEEVKKRNLLKPFDKVRREAKHFVEECVVHSEEAEKAKKDALARIVVLERDGKALADAASTALAEANKKLNAFEAERSAYGGEHITTLRTRLEAAEARAESSANIAQDALNELDRERTMRKSREATATKSLHSQVSAARSEAKEARQQLQALRTEVDQTLQNQQAEHTVALETAISKERENAQDAILKLKTEHQKLYANSQQKLKDAITNNQQLRNQAERHSHQNEQALSNLRHQLQQANHQLQALQHRSDSLEHQLALAKKKKSTHASSTRKNNEPRHHHYDNESTNKKAASSASSKSKGASGFLLTSTRLILLLYALALHVLVYFTFAQCNTNMQLFSSYSGTSSSLVGDAAHKSLASSSSLAAPILN